ncbi:MAG: NADH-quinone oxidoreductase subunit NuoK [Bacteroidota bacterium]
MIELSYFLAFAVVLFVVGVALVLTRRNIIMALMGIELMLNAANVNFVAFAQYDLLKLDGQMATLFVMALAAAEIAIALAIVLNVYKRFRTVRLDKIENSYHDLA